MGGQTEVQLTGTGVYDKSIGQIDPTHRALRTSLRPPEDGVYGTYRLTLQSGVIAAGIAANAAVWEMRWGQSTALAIVRKLRIQAVVSTTAFAATAADSSFSLFRASGFTAMDGTGATLAGFAVAKSQNNWTTQPDTQFASDSTANRTSQGGIGISNTAAMTAGTKTLGSNPIAVVQNRIVASAAAETIITPEDMHCYLIDPAEAAVIAPPMLNVNEGLVLRADAITGTGTWRLIVEVVWSEIDPARYLG